MIIIIIIEKVVIKAFLIITEVRVAEGTEEVKVYRELKPQEETSCERKKEEL